MSRGTRVSPAAWWCRTSIVSALAAPWRSFPCPLVWPPGQASSPVGRQSSHLLVFILAFQSPHLFYKKNRTVSLGFILSCNYGAFLFSNIRTLFHKTRLSNHLTWHFDQIFVILVLFFFQFFNAEFAKPCQLGWHEIPYVKGMSVLLILISKIKYRGYDFSYCALLLEMIS